MAVLAAENDLSTLGAFAAGLAPGVLTDVVIANLDHLPAQQAAPPGGRSGGGGSMAALAGLMQARAPVLALWPAQPASTSTDVFTLLML